MKVSKKELLSLVNSVRPYKLRSKRPCDFCRRKKACCIIEGLIPCMACVQLNKGRCTFLEEPVKRTGRKPAGLKKESPPQDPVLALQGQVLGQIGGLSLLPTPQQLAQQVAEYTADQGKPVYQPLPPDALKNDMYRFRNSPDLWWSRGPQDHSGSQGPLPQGSPGDNGPYGQFSYNYQSLGQSHPSQSHQSHDQGHQSHQSHNQGHQSHQSHNHGNHGHQGQGPPGHNSHHGQLQHLLSYLHYGQPYTPYQQSPPYSSSSSTNFSGLAQNNNPMYNGTGQYAQPYRNHSEPSMYLGSMENHAMGAPHNNSMPLPSYQGYNGPSQSGSPPHPQYTQHASQNGAPPQPGSAPYYQHGGSGVPPHAYSLSLLNAHGQDPGHSHGHSPSQLMQNSPSQLMNNSPAHLNSQGHSPEKYLNPSPGHPPVSLQTPPDSRSRSHSNHHQIQESREPGQGAAIYMGTAHHDITAAPATGVANGAPQDHSPQNLTIPQEPVAREGDPLGDIVSSGDKLWLPSALEEGFEGATLVAMEVQDDSLKGFLLSEIPVHPWGDADFEDDFGMMDGYMGFDDYLMA